MLHEIFHALLHVNSSIFARILSHYTIQHLKEVESNYSIASVLLNLMLASTIPNLKTVALSYANSHKYLSGSSVIPKYEWFHIQEPGESSPVLCLCILQVSIGCKRLLQRKR